MSLNPNVGGSVTLHELGKLLAKYPFKPFKPFGNEVAAFVAELPGDRSVHIGVFDGAFEKTDLWLSVSVAFGEVRHMFENRLHVGDRGMATASSSYKYFHDPDDLCGSALVGNELTGFKWRPSVVCGKGRTAVGRVDGYYQMDDIVEFLLDFERFASDSRPSKYDITGPEWDTAERGW